MFNPQIILYALVAMLASTGLGFYSGQHWANTKHEAQRASDLDAYNRQIKQQLAIADDLANRLHFAEGRIIAKQPGVIRYVTKHTTGAPCLSAGVVGVLQPGSNQGIRPPASQFTAEDAAPASSDSDVAYFIAQANQYYETCSARLTALIDFELMTNPEPQ